jgi:hypothetical protein
MIKIEFDPKQLVDLAEVMRNSGKSVRKELPVIINQTLRKTLSYFVKEIRKEILIPPAKIKQHLRITFASAELLSGKVKFYPRKYGKGIGVKYFKPRVVFGAGIEYFLGPRKTKKQFIPKAFIVAKASGHVFVRQGPKVEMSKGRYKGRMRQQIFRQDESNATDLIFREANQSPERTQKWANAELRKQVARRMQFMKAKLAGKLKAKKG